MNSLAVIKRNNRLAAIFSLLGFALLLAAFAYAVHAITGFRQQISEMQEQQDTNALIFFDQEDTIAVLETRIQQLEDSIKGIKVPAATSPNTSNTQPNPDNTNNNDGSGGLVKPNTTITANTTPIARIYQVTANPQIVVTYVPGKNGAPAIFKYVLTTDIQGLYKRKVSKVNYVIKDKSGKVLYKGNSQNRQSHYKVNYDLKECDYRVFITIAFVNGNKQKEQKKYTCRVDIPF